MSDRLTLRVLDAKIKQAQTEIQELREGFSIIAREIGKLKGEFEYHIDVPDAHNPHALSKQRAAQKVVRG